MDPVVQPVFKTGEVVQPTAGSVRLRGRSVKPKTPASSRSRSSSGTPRTLRRPSATNRYRPPERGNDLARNWRAVDIAADGFPTWQRSSPRVDHRLGESQRTLAAVPFLYHRRPQDLRDETLYPLNDLQALHPDLYALEAAKYEGRELVRELRIPLLEVTWNDAVHLAPIHPYHLAASWGAAGLSSRMWEREFLAIPVGRIDARLAVWFAYSTDVVSPLAEDEFIPFDADAYEELTKAPAAYAAYMHRLRESGRPGRHFGYVPHVLVAGPIDVSGLTCVRADEPPG